MKILIASSIDRLAIEDLRSNHDVVTSFESKSNALESYIGDREILIFRSGVKISADLMKRATSLILIIRAGSGLDNLDVEYVRSHGIKLVRIPEPSAIAVMEMTFALMFTLARKILIADKLLRQGRWTKYNLVGNLLTGKKLGIIGVGNIGTRVGQFGAALGMRCIGCVEHPSEERASAFRSVGIELSDFDNVVANADFLSLHVPLKQSTYHMINSGTISKMKPGSYLINTARGNVVDEEALYIALTDGSVLRGAALDVHKEEGEGKISRLAELPNVVLTPHIGAMTIDTQREIGKRIIEIIDSFQNNHS